jgi:glyoxylase-like metal-dependent hydrolase (beta-lactamase superfamily II)
VSAGGRTGILLDSIEGNRQQLDGGAMFGNVPRALWQTWLPPDAEHRVPLACRALLARNLAGATVLFEAGIGLPFPPDVRRRYGIEEAGHVLLASLAARGVQPDDVDVVVLSHLHFDHAGGVLSAWEEGVSPRLVFPRARFVVSRAAWDRARTPHPRDRASFLPALPPLLEASGRLEIVEGERAPSLGDAVRFHRSDGHTPGLLVSEIRGDAGGVLYCSDLVPGRPWVHLPITMGYDRAPERLVDEKRALLEHALARGLRLFFTHDPACALADVARDARGRFVATDPVGHVDGLDVGIPAAAG